eukprot:scpid104395/ scgid7246/ 
MQTDSLQILTLTCGSRPSLAAVARHAHDVPWCTQVSMPGAPFDQGFRPSALGGESHYSPARQPILILGKKDLLQFHRGPVQQLLLLPCLRAPPTQWKALRSRMR